MNIIDKPTVLFVDLQEGLLDAGKTQSVSGLRHAARALRTIAAILDLPCRASVIPAGPNMVAPLIAELADEPSAINAIPRHTISAISAIDSDCTHVVLAGIAMEGAILHTALAARQRGIAVSVAIDAGSGLAKRTEAAAIRQMEAAGVVTTSVASLATGWIDSANPEQKMALLQELRRLLD